ncbi:uncharacterized protein [Spinacia oleracea]|uniref:DUF4283 domain-containing protein n=1 Tax=Spinacia oleracea TaxID=3562 RepID=A0ABM3RNZ4_SPIOL|nr:uncharacterized protein LOC130471288 [Spinacia oleracea]
MCYVVGANPPIHVMEGFVRRIWKNMGVEKVVVAAKGVFLVRFTTMARRDEVLASKRPFFDSKPVVLKAWTQDMDFSKEDLRSVPIWVKLHQLDFKYWGEKRLTKIVGKLGTLKHVDSATAKRDKLVFARVQVEVSVEQVFPDKLQFINEKGSVTEIGVESEWRPVVCSQCKGMGHEVAKCRKNMGRRIWVPKVVVSPLANHDSEQVQQFQPVQNPSRRVKPIPAGISVGNHFQVLGVDHGEDQGDGGGGVNPQQCTIGGGDSSGSNG